VCPVRIPIPKIINRLRYEANHSDGVTTGSGSKRKKTEAMIWKAWSMLHARPALYRFMAKTVTRLRKLAPANAGPWTRYRTAPKPAARSLHDLARTHGVDDE
jgi:L-lactate dehydrogenase complex protein LldF